MVHLPWLQLEEVEHPKESKGCNLREDRRQLAAQSTPPKPSKLACELSKAKDKERK